MCDCCFDQLLYVEGDRSDTPPIRDLQGATRVYTLDSKTRSSGESVSLLGVRRHGGLDAQWKRLR